MSKTGKDASPWIVSTGRDRFDEDVFQRSQKTLVVVDFWAEWCAPCRMLTPVLEKLADEYSGKFLLVKANTDELPEAAGRLNVQAIPAVFAVRQGAIVDSFAGALPEPHIRAWLNRLLVESDLAEAERCEGQSLPVAEAKYRAILAHDPKCAEARIGLARTLLASERLDECRSVLQELEGRGFLEPAAERVRAALDLRNADNGNLDELRAAAAARPSDFALQLRLAESLAGAQQYEQGLEICLALIENDKKGTGERARQLMLDVFRVLPDDSELTRSFRRRLSMMLY